MTPSTNRLVVSFLDVGQGDCTLVCLPNSAGAVIVDCPESGSKAALDQLRAWGANELVWAIFTHSDYDHAGGMVDLIHNLDNRCRGFIFFEDRPWRGSEPGFKYRLLRQQLAELMRDGTLWERPDVGSLLRNLGMVAFRFIHPTPVDRMAMSDANYANEASLIIRIEYLGKAILLGGDVGGEGWQQVQDRQVDVRSDVLRVSHHGAWHQDGLPISRIAELVRPDTIVFSVGSQNPHGHPSASTVAAYIASLPSVRVLCTEVTPRCDSLPQDRRGAVEALLDNSIPRTQRPASCPCAGSIVVEISDAGLQFIPDRTLHNRVIDLFEHPLCRIGRRIN